jgi:hypothetical protein
MSGTGQPETGELVQKIRTTAVIDGTVANQASDDTRRFDAT